MDKSRRSFLKSALGLAVTQAFSLPALPVSRPRNLIVYDSLCAIADDVISPFVYHGTTTGRFSSNQPSYSNIPKFRREKLLFKQDFAAIEERILSQMGWYAALVRDLKPSFRIYHFDRHPLDMT